MTTQQAFALALQRHQAGRLADAEALYRQILTAQPGHAEALHHLGIVARQAGRGDLAVELIRQALVLNPGNPAAHYNLAEAYRATGRLDEAIASLRRALVLQPDLAAAHNNLGTALAEQHQPKEAAAAFRRALALEPDNSEFLNNLGNALREQGEFDEAIAVCLRALQLRPDYPEALNHLGGAHFEKGRVDEAVAAYRRALALNPNYAEAHNNLGVALAEQDQREEAVAAYRRAIHWKPDFPDAWNNLGIALADQGQLDEAIAAYRQTLQLQPDHANAWNNLGAAHKDRGELDAAQAAYQHAMRLNPAHAGMRSNFVYTLHFQPGQDSAAIAEQNARWNQQFAEPVRALHYPHTNDRDPERRLRVGYISPEFRDHVVGRNILPLFRHHDRSQCEILCYSVGGRADKMTAELGQLASLRNVAEVSDSALAEMIRADAVDILVDLTQHLAGNRLPVFARRPAPVQASFAGYPASTGLEEIPYRISDRYLEANYPEQGTAGQEQVCLIDSFWCYDPCGAEVEVNRLPASESGRVTFGSLNNFCKINEAVLRLWARVLGKTKGSRLILLSPLGSHRQRTRDILAREGIETERVEFSEPLGREAYLRLYHRLDMALDPFPYHGHTTSLDALWMGVPVISLAGSRSVSRAGPSQLSHLGLEEWVAFSEEDYAEIAARLADDLPRLAQWRSTLRARLEASPLMDAPRFARQVEAAYRTMWRQWCAQ